MNRAATWKTLALLTVMSLAAGCTRSTPPAGVGSAPRATDHALQGMALAGIKTTVVRYAPLRRQVRLTAQINLTETGKADVTAPLTGVIVNPLVKVGQAVAEGQPLAVINSAYGQTSMQILQKLEQDQAALVAAQSSLTQAQNGLGQAQAALGQARTAASQARDNAAQADAELVNAKADFKRKSDLFRSGVFAESDQEDARERLRKAQAVAEDTHAARALARGGVRIAQKNVPPAAENVRLARASVRLARATLERDQAIFGEARVSGSRLPRNLTPIQLGGGGQYRRYGAASSTEFYLRAPIAGTVTSVVMSAHMSCSPGTVCCTIVNINAVYADASAFESDLPLIRAGDPVALVVSSYPARTFHGTVKFVGQQVDASTRTVPVRARIANPGGVLRPGMFGTATVTEAGEAPVLAVPANAVLIHGDDRYLFVRTGRGQFKKRAVKVGLVTAGEAAITSGVRAGDVVVTDGNLILEGQE